MDTKRIQHSSNTSLTNTEVDFFDLRYYIVDRLQYRESRAAVLLSYWRTIQRYTKSCNNVKVLKINDCTRKGLEHTVVKLPTCNLAPGAQTTFTPGPPLLHCNMHKASTVMS